METLTIIWLTILNIILFAAWNGAMIMKKRKAWKAIGVIIRAIMVLTALYVGNFLFFIIAVNASWLFYDIIIAKIMGQKWWYLGNTTDMYAIIPKPLTWGLKLFFLIVLIIEIIKHII